MGLFNSGGNKVHCPGCGAKNEPAATRCRICTGFMQDDDGTVRGLDNAPSTDPADETGITIPDTTSTIPVSEDASPPPIAQADDSAGFDMGALGVDFKRQPYPPAETLDEALPTFDDSGADRPEPGRLELSQLGSQRREFNTPDATFERIGFETDSNADFGASASSASYEAF